MTSTLPDVNFAKSPIYEGLVAVRGDPYQVDRPARGWVLPAASTDFGPANDLLGRLLAQGGSDGQGWVAVVLVGGPAAAQLGQQLAQGTMAGQPGPFAGGYNPLAVYQAAQAMQAVQAMQALQNQGQPWPQPELAYPVATHAVAADPYAASALTPAADPAAHYAAMQAHLMAQAQAQLETSGQYPVMPMTGQPQPSMMPGAFADTTAELAPAVPYGAIPPGTPASALPPGVDMSAWIDAANAAALQEIQAAQSDEDPGPRDPTPTMAFPPGMVPMMPAAYPGYPGAA